MRRPRMNHIAAFKAKVAVAALHGDKTLIQLAQQFDAHANQITPWKTQWFDRAKDSLKTAAERSESASPSVKDIQAKTGPLALENDPRSSRRQAFGPLRSSDAWPDHQRYECQAMIDRNDALLVVRQCEIRSLLRSSVYYYPGAVLQHPPAAFDA